MRTNIESYHKNLWQLIDSIASGGLVFLNHTDRINNDYTIDLLDSIKHELPLGDITILKGTILDGNKRLSALHSIFNKKDSHFLYDSKRGNFVYCDNLDINWYLIPTYTLLDSLTLLKFIRKVEIKDKRISEHMDRISKIFLYYKLHINHIETDDINLIDKIKTRSNRRLCDIYDTTAHPKMET